MTLRLEPYTSVDGVPTFRDSEIMALYQRMEAEKTAEMVSGDGSVKSAEQFLRLARQPSLHFSLAFLGEAGRFQQAQAQNQELSQKIKDLGEAKE